MHLLYGCLEISNFFVVEHKDIMQHYVTCNWCVISLLTAWILFFLIEEGFALAQRTKGKLELNSFYVPINVIPPAQDPSEIRVSYLCAYTYFLILSFLPLLYIYLSLFLSLYGCFFFSPHTNPPSTCAAFQWLPHWSPTQQPICLFSAFRLSDSQNDHGGQSPNQNDCGTWVRNINGGVFTSPNYPNTYPPNKECVYILEGKAFFHVSVSLSAW